MGAHARRGRMPDALMRRQRDVGAVMVAGSRGGSASRGQVAPPGAAMVFTVLLLISSAASAGMRDNSQCKQPIRPIFSAPRSTDRHAGEHNGNHTYGQYLLLTAAPYEDDQALFRTGEDSAGSWFADDGKVVAETVAAEDWMVMVYCRSAPDVFLGSITLQARLEAEPMLQQPREAAAALKNGALVITDDISLHIFGWNDIDPCLPQAFCSTIRMSQYYETETPISKFIAFVAVGTIALTSVTFICVSVIRQPCWSESNFDDRYWEPHVDIDNLESHDLGTATAKPEETDTRSTETGTGVHANCYVASGQAVASYRDPRRAHEAAQKISKAASPSPAELGVSLRSSAATDGNVRRTRYSLQLDASDGNTSDDSIDSFNSASEVQTVIHSRMV